MQRDHGALAREKKAGTAEAEFMANERAKKAHYENLTMVKGMSKTKFRRMREQPLFDMPQTSSDP